MGQGRKAPIPKAVDNKGDNFPEYAKEMSEIVFKMCLLQMRQDEFTCWKTFKTNT